MVTFLVFMACTRGQQDLSEQGLLTRLSLDLRGYRPSLLELENLASNGLSESDLIEEFLSAPTFPRQMAHFFAPTYNTRQDETLYPAAEFGLSGEFAFAFSVGDEPLKIIEEVIANDLPWPTIVTANWTMVNEDLASIYPVEYPEGATGWQRVEYTDGRPPAGVLSSNGLWWRYETSRNNASRARANQISRILLCHDYLDREVEFDRGIDLSDEEVRQHALQNNDGCVSCHASLDPLASFLGGVFVPRKSGATEMIYYHPERETIWREQTGVAPSYYGQPGVDLADLGRMIAMDPQFAQCTVEQVTEFLWQSSSTVSDVSELHQYREDFLHGGLNIKELVRSIVSSERYQSVLYDKEATDKVVSPIQLASQVENLTGFRFTSDGYDMLLSEVTGFYAMAGGGDGRFSNAVRSELSVPLLLIQQKMALMAADYWIEQNPTSIGFDVNTNFDEEQLRSHLSNMNLRILSTEPSKDELQELVDYYNLVVASFDRKTAWKSIVRLLLQDPQMLVY